MSRITSEHVPVLVNEVLTYLNPQPGGVYLDATFGSGGHTRALLEKEPECHVVALDWDAQALDEFGTPLQEAFPGRLTLLWGNFAQCHLMLKKAGITELDGALADFGTSYAQISERAGFSVYRDTPLDMRMSPAHQRVTAAEVLRSSSEEKLRELFWQLGDERHAKLIARAIVTDRVKKPLTTTLQLAQLIERVVPTKGKQRIHPATRVFQALRIYVNKELENIKGFLSGVLKLVKPGGAIVCISFHSLEDRLVKRFFKERTQPALHQLDLLTPQIVVATQEELERNPSARSAKLRAAQVCAE